MTQKEANSNTTKARASRVRVRVRKGGEKMSEGDKQELGKNQRPNDFKRNME